MPLAILQKPHRLWFESTLFERDVPRRVTQACAQKLTTTHPGRFQIDWQVAGPAASELPQPGEVARPADTAVRLEQIRDAVARLDPDDEGHFTQDGKPNARVLSELLGWAVSAEERDQALAEPRKAVKVTRREPVRESPAPLDEGAVEVV